MSKLFVRPAEPRREREGLTELLRRNLPDLDHRGRFEWLYLDNPAGEAWAWLLCDGEPFRIVGAAAIFPKYLWSGGAVTRVGQVGDFAIDAAHRSLGPAVMLQKATAEAATDGSLAFCYDCPPHERGMSTFRRMRVEPTLQTHRFIKLVRLDEALRRRAPLPDWALALPIAGANAVLTAVDRLRGGAGGVRIAELEGDFDESFDALDEIIAKKDSRLRARRRAEDLNWRFRRDPLRDYDVLVARRGGVPVGYAVLWRTGSKVRVVDLVGDTEAVVLGLLDGARELARAGRHEALLAIGVGGSPEADALRRAGFHQREAAESVVTYGAARPVSKSWGVNAADVML